MLNLLICGCAGDIVLGIVIGLFIERLWRWASKYFQNPWSKP